MKAIPSENYQISPFLTHKHQTYVMTFLSGSNPDQVSIDLAVVPPTGSLYTWVSGSEPINPSGIPMHTLYESVEHIFYQSNSLWTPNSSFLPTGSQFYVLGCAQTAIGEGIRPTSFKVTTPLSSASLYDDGKGNIVSTVATGSVIGNIFYTLGVVVIQQDISSVSSSLISNNGMFLVTGSVVDISFDASQTIYEHRITCTMDVGDFNYPINPSVLNTSSLGGPGKVLDYFASGTLTPYMTTVGIYNDAGELVATGKFPRPIKRAVESQQTIVVRWDA